MNTSSMKADFLAAKAKTAVTIMNGMGWKDGVVNPGELGVDSVFFYVFDQQTKWLWCCSVPKVHFYKVVNQSEGLDKSDSITYCGQMIADCAAGNALNPDKENELAIALIGYIRITRTYELTEKATHQNHFVVIRYGSTDNIRPFALSGPQRHLLAANEVQKVMAKVIGMDTKNHPEWMAT